MDLYCKTTKPGWRKLIRKFSHKDTEVPVGFEWNGANPEDFTEGNWFKRFIGRQINNVVPRFCGTIKSSCIHDYLCREADKLASVGKMKEAKKMRSKGDKYFKELSETGKVSTWLGYQGVKFGTWFKFGGY